jgi:phosphotransferase system enzyme I (PtsI)
MIRWVILEPDTKTNQKFRGRINFLKKFNQDMVQIRNKRAITTDQYQVKVFNNIELPNESSKVIKSGAEGIGLFRTEYLFLTENGFPTLEQQYKLYKSVLSKMSGQPVFIRTFDLGSDKFVADKYQAVDPNPFLGWRAIRFCLDRPDIFKNQLKALLRASNYGDLRIMLPMISNLDEVRQTKDLLEECRIELAAEKVKFRLDIPLGIMIEVPSAVIMADHLAKEVDFFSIGTNDLIQYILAVDRTNEKITGQYQSFNPAVFKMIKQTIDSGHRHNIDVSLCGELASDPLAIIVLIGLGIDQLSASYHFSGLIKYIVRNIDRQRAAEIAKEILDMQTESQVMEYLHDKTHTYFPELIPIFDFMQGVNNG